MASFTINYTLMSSFSTRYSQCCLGGVGGVCARPCRGERRVRNRTCTSQKAFH